MRFSHTEVGAGPELDITCHARSRDSVFCFLPDEQQLFLSYFLVSRFVCL